MKILITGGDGFIATNLVKYLKDDQLSIISVNRKNFDLSCHNSTQDWFGSTNEYFDVVIHAASQGGSRLKEDNTAILDNNIKMYYNLVSNNKYFNKLINLGSGAEDIKNNLYGLSKKIIHLSIQNKPNFFNLKLYAIFNENELKTRFIKNNILRYINQEKLIIHKNKYMDFMYFEDFVLIIKQYIKYDNLPKSIDCVYEQKYCLLDIANIINKIDIYSSDIEILNTKTESDYIGQFTDLNIKYTGIKQGILNTYKKLKHEKNMVCPE